MKRDSGATGLLIVDKPAGPSSHQVVAQARRLYGTRRVGHAGTLDPLATGVLLVLLGEATKLSAHLTGQSKRYRAEVDFSCTTPSLDRGSEPAEPRDPRPVALEPLETAVAAERQRLQQLPPSISAVKVEGRRAYALTRAGRPPDLELRPIQVLSLSLLELSGAVATLELEVSKGYYVRALARDLGERIGRGGHLASLRRLSSGAFSLGEAIEWPPPSSPPEPIPLAQVLRRNLPQAELTDAGTRKARLGQALGPQDFVKLPADSSIHAWFGPDGQPIALGRSEPSMAGEAGFRVSRGFQRPSDAPTAPSGIGRR